MNRWRTNCGKRLKPRNCWAPAMYTSGTTACWLWAMYVIGRTLIKRLRSHELKTLMDKESAQLLAKPTALNRYEQTVLLRGLNAAINTKARQAWQVQDPDMTRLAARYGELRSELAVDFAGALSDSPQTWGSSTIQTLRDAGLAASAADLGRRLGGWPLASRGDPRRGGSRFSDGALRLL